MMGVTLGQLEGPGAPQCILRWPSVGRSSVIPVLRQKPVVLHFYVAIMLMYFMYPFFLCAIGRNSKRLQPEAVELGQFLFFFLS